MQRLFRVLIYSASGAVIGALTWGAIVQAIIFSLDLKHGEGFASIPSLFLGWLALIVGGMNGTVIGLTLGYFGTVKISRGALLAVMTTLVIILGYYLVIDPGFSLIIWSSSLLSLRNLAVVAIILTAPSPLIGIITTLVYAKIFKRFETAQRVSLPVDLRSDTKELVKSEHRTDKDAAD